MWSMLRRNQERLIVGAATTLVMLAVLAHARAGFAKPVPGAAATAPTLGSVSVATLGRVPRDPEFYRKKWRQIANEFYAAHPVDLSATSATVVTASLSDQGDDVNYAASQVSTAAHTVPTTIAEPTIVHTIAGPMPRITRVRPPAFFAAVAAGLLASLLYGSIWPVKRRDERHGLECSDSLRIELPSQWVRIRPTPIQRLRPIVLCASSIGGVLAAWSIILH